MPSNAFTLSAPIVFPALDTISIKKATDVDDTAKEITLILEISGDSGDPDKPFRFWQNLPVKLTNTQADRLVVNFAVPTMLEAFAVETLQIAGAYNRVMLAYNTAAMQGQNGNRAMLVEMAAIGLIPPGSAA